MIVIFEPNQTLATLHRRKLYGDNDVIIIDKKHGLLEILEQVHPKQLVLSCGSDENNRQVIDSHTVEKIVQKFPECLLLKSDTCWIPGVSQHFHGTLGCRSELASYFLN